MPVGKPLHLRLFLEGEEVPVVAAQVSINVSAPSTASIQIVPLDSALDFLPRTMVHLFFLDTRVDTTQGPRQEGQSNLNGTYRLLFSGEVVGFAWSQTPSSRGIVLQCLDFSNYWDSAHVMAISYGPGGNAFTNQGALNGAALGTFTDIPGDSAAEKLVRWVRSPPVTPGLTGISGLAGGVIHIMEAMGGVPGHFKGVNDFYTIAELRCRLLNQITAEENDTTASRVLSINVFHEWLKNGIEQAGGNVTFRDVMKLLFNYIHYEFVPNPAPKFDDGKAPESSTPYTAKLRQAAAKDIATLESIFNATLINYDLVSSNALPSSAALSLLMDDSVKSLDAVIKHLKKIGSSTAQVVQILTEVKAGFSKIRIPDVAPTVNSAGIQTSLSKLDQYRLKLQDATNKLKGSDSNVKLTNPPSPQSSQRLRTQIVRPDCWFASPPACNIIFPETYASLAFDRNYLQETTRLLVATFHTLVGRDRLLAKHVLSPFVGLDSKKLERYKGNKSFRILMDHEIHVGIISRSEWLPDTAGVSSALDAEEMKKVQDHRLSWQIKAGLFNFFKYRFGARQVSVSGRFNPFLVCGFPGAVITRPYIINGGAEALRQAHNGKPVPDSEINDIIHAKASELGAPSHFVGMIGAIQHSVDQGGGTTSAVLHHTRKHRGADDEFVGILMNTNEGKAKRIIKVILDVDTAEELATQPTPNFKPINLLVGVTPQKVETPTTSAPLDKPSRLRASPSTKKAKKVSVDPREKLRADVKDALSVLQTAPAQPTIDEQFEATFSPTQVEESDSNQKQSAAKKNPPRTTKGSIQDINRTDVLIPFGSTAVKVNEKKGLYGGKIVGIEVLDADAVEVSYQSSYKSREYVPVSDDATARQLEDVPGFNELRRSVTVTKFTKTRQKQSRGVAFKKVAVYEEVEVSVSGTLPIEEILRPSWFSTAYANPNIGKKIYTPFFGCGAVVDGLSVSGEGAPSADASADSEPVDAATSAKDLTTRIAAEEQVKRDNSLEKALNILGYQYGQVKSQGMDVESFIRDYTDRPIATITDIFGEPDLSFNITDAAVGGNAVVKTVTQNGVQRTPRVGFHTGAVHPSLAKLGKLIGLTTDLQQGFTRINGVGAQEPLVTLYDVRPAKKERVQRYLEELEKGPGFRG